MLATHEDLCGSPRSPAALWDETGSIHDVQIEPSPTPSRPGLPQHEGIAGDGPEPGSVNACSSNPIVERHLVVWVYRRKIPEHARCERLDA